MSVKHVIKMQKKVRLKHLNNPNAYISCSNDMDDFYSSNEDHISRRKKN